MIRLEKMSQFECEAFVLISIPNYAQSVARDRDIQLKDALLVAQKTFQTLLPDWSGRHP